MGVIRVSVSVDEGAPLTGEKPRARITYVDRAARDNVVRLQRLVVRQLLATVNQPDLVHLDTLLLLELLFDIVHSVRLLEVECLFAAREGLDGDLHSWGEVQGTLVAASGRGGGSGVSEDSGREQIYSYFKPQLRQQGDELANTLVVLTFA